MADQEGSRTDAASLIGLPLTLVVVMVAQVLEGGHLRTLAQPTAALVVFGGTFAALLVSFPMGALVRAVRSLGAAFRKDPAPTRELVHQFGQYSQKIRRKGMLAIEAEITPEMDSFLARGLMLAVDGFAPADVKRALELDSDARHETDEQAADVFESAGGYAPTLGILGAVLGLIHVMENLADPSKLGAGIAVAFVATVYGVGSANLIFLPLANKLRTVARSAALSRQVVIEGVSALQANVHPRLIEQQLSAFIRARETEQENAARSKPAA
jgi:chemotaxis protein MotA